MISESFVHALLLCLGLFLKISRWVPLAIVVNTIFQRIYRKNRVEFPEERIVFVFGHQHGWHDVTCEPVTETTPLQYDLLTSKMSKQSILLARE